MSEQQMTVTINITVQVSVTGAERDALLGYWEQHRLAEPAHLQEAAAATEILQSAAAAAARIALPEASVQAVEGIMIEQVQGEGIILGDRVLNETMNEGGAIPMPAAPEAGMLAAGRTKEMPVSGQSVRRRPKQRKDWEAQRMKGMPATAKSNDAAKLRAVRERFVKARPHRRILNKQARPIGPPQ